MKRQLIITLVSIFFIAGFSACDLFVEDVGSTSITGHTVSGSNGSITQISISWNWADAADNHVLERSAPDDGQGFTEIFWDSAANFTDHGHGLPNGFEAEHRYVYRVRGHSDDAGFGPWSSEYTVTAPALLPPSGFSGELIDRGDDDFSNDIVRLSWDMIDLDEAGYEIFRSEDVDDLYPPRIHSISIHTTVMYEDDISEDDAGKTFYYWICTTTQNYGNTEMTGPIAVDMNPVPRPVMHDAVRDGDTSVTIRWNPVDVGHSYMLFRAQSNPELDGSYTALWNEYKRPETDNMYIERESGYLKAVDSNIENGVQYYYKVKCRTWSGIESGFSENYETGGGSSGGSGSWLTLGSEDFAQTADDIELVTSGGTLYLLFPDSGEGSQRIKAMRHDGSDSASWSNAGGYISLDSAEDDNINASSDGSTVYVAYGDTDPIVTSGGSPRLFVKSFDGSSWNTAGSSDGIAVYDDQAQANLGKWGSRPALCVSGSEQFMVYRTDSGGIIDSLSYSGSGDNWEEEDSDFWFPDNTIASSDIALDVFSSGNYLAVLENGTDSSFDFYSYDGSGWSTHSSLSVTDEGTGMLYIYDFLIDSNDVPYVSYETIGGSGLQAETGIYSWNGSSWISVDFASQLDGADTISDIALTEISGGGIIAAAAYENDSSQNVLEVWGYSGGTWSQIGPAIEAGAGLDDIDLALDSGDRPVVVYEKSGGSLTAAGFRE